MFANLLCFRKYLSKFSVLHLKKPAIIAFDDTEFH